MKKLLISLGILILIIVIALAIGVSNLGPIIKKAVNSYGPQITKTHVYVDDVGVSLLSGEAKLKEFALGNPQGFASPEAISVGSIYINIDEKSLTNDTIVIETIKVIKPVISYEKKSGTDNFTTIMKNMSKEGPADPAPAEPEAKRGGKTIAIRDLVIKDGTVNLAVSGPAGSRTVSAQLPDIHLKDLGGDKGTEPAEVTRLILAAIYKNVGSPIVTDALKKSSEVVNEALDKAREDVHKGVDSTREQVREELNKARKLFKK